MTRKDYILIARTLQESNACAQQAAFSTYTPAAALRQYANAIATALASDNPSFDRERFLKACGVQS